MLLVDKVTVVGSIDNYQLSQKCLEAAGFKITMKSLKQLREILLPLSHLQPLMLDPQKLILISPSDHIIHDAENYSKAVEKASKLAQ